jgi:hypothetical protein
MLAAPGCDDVTAEVQETLDQYINARRSGDAETVLKLVDPKNIEYYDHIVEMARSGKWTDITRMPMLERFQVGCLRVTLKPEELKTFDGRQWLKKQVAEHFEASGGLGPDVTITDIKYRKPRATGALVIEGRETKLRLEFVQVEGQWLVNEESLNEWMNRKLLEVCKMMGRTEEGFVVDLISAATGKRVNVNTLGDPPK